MRVDRLALLAVAAAAVIGFSVGVATREDAGASGVGGQLGMPGALLDYPGGWQLSRGPAELLGTPIATSAALAPQGAAGARLVAGTIRGRTPADLPALLAAYDGAVRSQVVLLQGRAALHLTGVRDGDRTLELFVLPVRLTSPVGPGLVTIACSVPDGAPASFLPGCRRLAAQATIVGVAPVADLRPSPDYATRVDAALARLGRERSAARAALRARRTAAAQAQDAQRAAMAATVAARTIAAAAPPEPARRVNDAVAQGLRATAAAYTALATAARRGDAAAFTVAGTAVAGAERRTARALRGLTVLGYTPEY